MCCVKKIKKFEMKDKNSNNYTRQSNKEIVQKILH